MKHALYAFFLLAVVLACGKKQTAVDPDIGARIAGTYEVTTVRQSVGAGLTLQADYPLSYASSTGAVTTQSAQIVAVRQTQASVGVTVTQKETGQPGEVEDYSTADIRGNALYLRTTRLGSVDGATMSLILPGSSVSITAKQR